MTDHQATGFSRRTLLAAAGAGGTLAAAGTPAIVVAETAPPPRPASADSTPPEPRGAKSAAAAARAVADAEASILQISREVWATPELSLAEEQSHKVHIRELEAVGFAITSRGTSGIPTAFIAEWTQGVGGPVIAYLPEYDALPGLGNAAEPKQAPAPGGSTIGHGCGHNMLGAGCTGAAIALKAMMQDARVSGTIRVYGCAGEEVEGAKVYMARDELFSDVDAALAWHPAPVAGTGLVRTAALDKVKVRFHGRSAHAGNSPWEGRSALKGAEMFGIGVQMMREHLLPTARVHYIYEAAGVAPNIVPDFAEVWIVSRDIDRPTVEANTAWLKDIANGAATATQTTVDFEIFFGAHDLLPNEPIARLLDGHIAATPLEWTEDEISFAKACQKSADLPQAGMVSGPLPFVNELNAGASTDVGDVSYQVPTGVFAWPTFPLGFGLHTWAVTACAGTSIGDKASLNTARILAAAGFDLVTEPDLLRAAKEDHRQRRGDTPFVSAIPRSRTQPLALETRFIKTGDEEIFSNL